MKTNFTKLLSLCFFLLLGYTASAQNDTRSVGETKAYTVTPESGTNGLAWTISGTQGTDWDLTAGALDQASVTVIWMKPGTYTMTFTETESHGGIDCSTTKSLTVTVNDNFSVAIADAATAASCATGSTGTTKLTFVLTKTNGGNNWTFDYTTDGLATEITGNDVAVTGDTYNLEIDLPNMADGSDQTFKIKVTDVKDNFGNLSTAGDVETANVTIYGVPNTGNITF